MLRYEYRTGIEAINAADKLISVIGIGELGQDVINGCLEDEFYGLDYHYIDHLGETDTEPYSTLNDGICDAIYTVPKEDSLINDSSYFALTNDLNHIDTSKLMPIGNGGMSGQPSDKVLSEIQSRNSDFEISIIVLDVSKKPDMELAINVLDNLSGTNVYPILVVGGNNKSLIENERLLENLIKKSGSIVDLVSKALVGEEDNWRYDQYWHPCSLSCLIAIDYITQVVSGDVSFRLSIDDVKHYFSDNKYIRLISSDLTKKADGLWALTSDKHERLYDLDYSELKLFRSLYYYVTTESGKNPLFDIKQVIESDRFSREDESLVVFKKGAVIPPKNNRS